MTNLVDRIYGVLSTLAIKAPCKAVAIANITLSGEQTVNGVAVTAGDRVLVTAQTDATENGIYDVAASTWTRSADFDGNRDVTFGTIIPYIAPGGSISLYNVTNDASIVIGTTELVISDTLGAVGSLTDLSDVLSAAVTNRFALLANGSQFVSRAIVEADISDLGAYLDAGDIGVSVQSWSAHLDDIGALSAATGADQFMVSTGAGAWALESGATVRTSLGLGALAVLSDVSNDEWNAGSDLAVVNGGTGASDAVNARINLGLVIGTNVQAYDAGLNSIAGLTTAADKMIYTSASDVYAVADLSSFARTLLDDANAAAARATLAALGNVVEDTTPQLGGTLDCQDNVIQNHATNSSSGWTEPVANTVQFDVSAGGQFNVDLDDGSLTGNVTIAFTGYHASGKTHAWSLLIRQKTASPYTVAWPAEVKWPGGVAPVMSTGADAIDIFSFVTTNGGTDVYGTYLQNFS